MHRSLDFARLEQFLAVARLGSFSRAAAELATTQPSLTRNMRSLEADMGARLFDRGARGTQLTEAGRRFHPRAEAMVNELERALAELEPGHEAETDLRIGVSPSFLHDVLPVALADLAGALPDLRVSVSTGTREILGDALTRNAIDLALCLMPEFFFVARQDDRQAFAVETIGEERIAAFVAPGHPAAGARELAALVGHGWAVPLELSVSYRFESAFYRRGLSVPHQALRAASLSLVAGAALERGQIALLPARVAARDVAAGRLLELACADARFPASLAVLTRRGEVPHPAQLRAVAEMRSAAAG